MDFAQIFFLCYSGGMSTSIIASDLHGDLQALQNLYSLCRIHDVSHLILAGDQCPGRSDSYAALLNSCPVPLLSVRGNCDSGWEYDAAGLHLPPRFRIMDAHGRTLLITHGDIFLQPQDTGIVLKAGDIFITGHTHVPLLQVHSDGWIHVNPGSASRPRGIHGPTFTLVDDGGISIRLMDTGKDIMSLAFTRDSMK